MVSGLCRPFVPMSLLSVTSSSQCVCVSQIVAMKFHVFGSMPPLSDKQVSCKACAVLKDVVVSPQDLVNFFELHIFDALRAEQLPSKPV